MKKIKVGIDFGTSQTKICSRNIDNDQNQFVFHKFSFNDDYSLPTTISVEKSGKCLFGITAPNSIRFFKMKALFSENEFYKNQLTHSIKFDLKNHPEICCILYLCYCILDIKSTYKIKTDQPNEKKSILSRFFKNKSVSDSIEDSRQTLSHQFHFTVGIPTRYDWTPEEHKRRSLQYEMLYLALELSNSYENLNTYLEDNLKNYLDKIRVIYVTFLNIEKKDLLDFYASKNIFIVAETTAGIFVLLNRFQRTLESLRGNYRAIEKFKKSFLGNYITLDVGAGTTDVSFFSLTTDRNRIRLDYHASETIDYASNFLIRDYLKLRDNLDEVSEDDIATFNFLIDDKIWNTALGYSRTILNKRIRSKILQGLLEKYANSFRNNWQFDENNTKAKGCKVYGGGSKLNAFARGQIELHNQGVLVYNPALTVTTEIHPLIEGNGAEYLTNIEFINTNGSPFKKKELNKVIERIHYLNTALGLCMVDNLNNPNALQAYRKNHSTLIIPANNEGYDEGMIQYDIFNRDWL
ncbi:acetate and sugar kinases/Hsc70/actin family protein [Sediminibacterium sp. TEGAF015]|uniref:hypothetical protein n=1 Tax=Sediminibacterium sp. TEGAF015 TaxID=575378 RepID=UPI002208C3BE|nr:hypothetical protein [Sediminibacterium sp. TEGAF015]BDQ12748.1 hypothetical protein TEGAF0_19650 [Sediminibacterium sp. TEGAF015]